MFTQSNYVRLSSGCGYDWGVVGLAVVSILVGVLHYTKPSGGMSSACRTLM